MENNPFQGFGIEVELQSNSDETDPKIKYRDAFLRIRETLTRIGIPSYKTNSLYQSVHLLHKRGCYSLFHFKELFAIDGKSTNLTKEDIGRRNAIAGMLEEYGLLKIKEPDKYQEKITRNFIKIIPFKDKSNWKLCSKYSIGNKQNERE